MLSSFASGWMAAFTLVAAAQHFWWVAALFAIIAAALAALACLDVEETNP